MFYKYVTSLHNFHIILLQTVWIVRASWWKIHHQIRTREEMWTPLWHTIMSTNMPWPNLRGMCKAFCQKLHLHDSVHSLHNVHENAKCRRGHDTRHGPSLKLVNSCQWYLVSLSCWEKFYFSMSLSKIGHVYVYTKQGGGMGCKI
jgi:hypothetical protein